MPIYLQFDVYVRFSYILLYSFIILIDSRAAGKSSHEKLLVFYYALQLSGLYQLADGAASALSKFGVIVKEK